MLINSGSLLKIKISFSGNNSTIKNPITTIIVAEITQYFIVSLTLSCFLAP